jgi:glucosamine--fructose-6-phosphate aminotransferase (isomerizing)
MTAVAQVATELGESNGAAGVTGFREALTSLPDAISGLLARADEIEPIAMEANARRVYAAGAGPNEATALELVIKAREAAYGDVDGLALEQYLHGPMVGFNAASRRGGRSDGRPGLARRRGV